jgi:phosphohistidine swiveling domain-containing protein
MQKQIKWNFVYSEGHSMLMNQAFFHALTDYPKIPGIFNTIFYINREGLQTCYVPVEEMERVNQEGKDFFDYRFRNKFKKAINKCRDDFEKFFVKFESLKIAKISNKQLARLIGKYYKQLSLFCAYYQVSGGRVFLPLEDYVHEELSKYFPKDKITEVYGELLAENEINNFEEEQHDLMRIVEKESVNDYYLREHAKRFAASYFNTYDEQVIFSFLRKRAEEIKKNKLNSKIYLEEIKGTKAKIRKNQDKLMSKFKENSELISVIDFLRMEGAIRFNYKEWFMGAEYKFLELFKEISNRIEISLYDYFASYKFDDTLRFLTNGIKLTNGEIDKRKRAFVFCKIYGKSYFAVDDAENFVIKYHVEPALSSIEIRGTIASVGVVKGKARVILPKSFEQLNKEMERFNDGDIIVTTMTQPALVRIMKKAAAIVTNQGGLTSHAAVLSREFKIPCIVGTHVATSVFKDGDMIEVDANKGIVRKINK